MIPFARTFARLPIDKLLRRRYKELSLDDLEKLIDEIRGASVIKHLNVRQWARLDAMRSRAIQLRKLQTALRDSL